MSPEISVLLVGVDHHGADPPLPLAGLEQIHASGTLARTVADALQLPNLESIDAVVYIPDASKADPLDDLLELVVVMARVPVLVVLRSGLEHLEGRVVELGAWECSLAPEVSRARFVRQLKHAAELVQTRRSLERARARAQILLFHASHDPLTGLSNRSRFVAQLRALIGASVREGAAFALAFVDVDRFKDINDTFSNEVGDALLQQVALRLSAVARPHDLVARTGGDEFALLFRSADPSGGAVLARRISDAFLLPFQWQGIELYLTAGVGIALFPGHANELDGLLRSADLALWKAKSAGRGSSEVFSARLAHDGIQRLNLERRLRRALEDDVLQLYYQPQLDLGTGRVVGFEGLMRWPDGEGGFIPPSLFVPLAEETGLITSVGNLALDQACRQLARWRTEGRRSVYVGVNVSVMQLEVEDFSQRVAHALETYHLDPGSLEIELTESMSIRNEESALEQLRRLRQMGVGVAIDDFGTGHNGLPILSKLPVSTLKIDRSFIVNLDRNTHSRPLVESVLDIARRLQLKVVAEGVERPDQLEALRQLHCDRAQGYLFARALPPAEAELTLVGSLFPPRGGDEGKQIWS